MPAIGGGARPAPPADEDEALEPPDWWVAMTVGNTKEGSELPAKLECIDISCASIYV